MLAESLSRPQVPSMCHQEPEMPTSIRKGVRAIAANAQVNRAEARGFEPRMGANPNRISSAAP
jgi:hypothetical protein